MVCEHFPKGTINQCPLCYPETIYEIKHHMWKNEPIVEIFRDSKPWDSPWDSNFRFGKRKAAMILYCNDIIKDFALYGKMIPEPIFYIPDPDLKVRIQTFSLFKNKDGKDVYEPFMELKSVKYCKIEEEEFHLPTSQAIRFGLLKAIALISLRNEIEQWLKKVGGWYS